MKLKTLVVYLLCSLVMTLYSKGQTKDYTDFQTWYGAGLKLDLPKGFDFTTQYRIRIVDDASTVKGSYITGQLDYKINSYLKTLAAYRLALVTDGVYHRFGIGAEVEKKFHRLEFSFRPIVQYQKQYFEGDDEKTTDSDYFLRTKGEIGYQLTKRWDLSASAEPFFNLESMSGVSNMRNMFNVKYKVTKQIRLNLYYLWQADWSKKNDRNNHIVGFNIDYTWKPFKK